MYDFHGLRLIISEKEKLNLELKHVFFILTDFKLSGFCVLQNKFVHTRVGIIYGSLLL